MSLVCKNKPGEVYFLQVNGRIQFPWHFILFGNFRWYQRLTKGLYVKRKDGKHWIRVNRVPLIPDIEVRDFREPEPWV